MNWSRGFFRIWLALSVAWIVAILIIDAVNYVECSALHLEIVRCGPGVTLVLAPPAGLLVAMIVCKWIARGFSG